MLSRHGNDYIMQLLPQLSGLRSLRHLQLYKTSPLLPEDMHKIGQLTQLTSLLLVDQSYMPGAEASVPVDISLLSSLTRLESLCVAGICPSPPSTASLNSIETGASMLETVSAQSLTTSSSSIAQLPASLMSVVIKRVDDWGVRCWSDHLLQLARLQSLQVLNYLEPASTAAFEAFPSPLFSRLAQHLSQLTELSFGIADEDNYRTRRLYRASAALPRDNAVAHLKLLQSLNLTACQMLVQNAADWQALASLTALSSLWGMDAKCMPPAGLQFPKLQRLGLDSAQCWQPAHAAGQAGNGRAWRLNATFPGLVRLGISLHSDGEWLGVQPVLAALTGMTRLCLDFLFRLDVEAASAFEHMGYQLPALRSLSLVYSGGPDGWRLPRLLSYTQLNALTLQLATPGTVVPIDEHDPLVVTDTVVLAHLLPLRGLTQLMLNHLPGITPGVVLGLCAALPQLDNLTIMHCREVTDADQYGSLVASWEGFEVQLARAALSDAAARVDRVPCVVEVYAHESQAYRAWQELPCEVTAVSVHQRLF
jgi:hypothetical protein